MSSSPILRSASRFLVALLALVSFFFLLRGTTSPAAASSAASSSPARSRSAPLRSAWPTRERCSRSTRCASPRSGSCWRSGADSSPSSTARRSSRGAGLAHPVPGIGKVGTILLFDVGVFLTVVGTALTILFAVWSETAEPAAPRTPESHREDLP